MSTELADVSAGDLELLAAVLEPSTLAPDWRQRLLACLTHEGRFDRFVPNVAELLAVERSVAGQYLDLLGQPNRWVPGLLSGMSLIHLEQGQAIGPAIAGFVRLASGTEFPEHQHIGQESVLIIQGSYDDSGRIARPGDRVVMPAGSSHSFVVRPGPDLVYLAVVEHGLRIGGREFLPQDADI
jgi:hypothetical protein